MREHSISLDPLFMPQTSTQTAQARLIDTSVETTLGQVDYLDQHGQVIGSWRLRSPRCIIGSNLTCSVCLTDPSVAENHAILTFGKRYTLLKALAQPTKVGDRPIREWLIDSPTEVQIGNARLIVYPRNYSPVVLVPGDQIASSVGRLRDTQGSESSHTASSTLSADDTTSKSTSLPQGVVAAAHPELDTSLTTPTSDAKALVEEVRASLDSFQNAIDKLYPRIQEEVSERIESQFQSLSKQWIEEVRVELLNSKQGNEAELTNAVAQVQSRIDELQGQVQSIAKSSGAERSELIEWLQQQQSDRQSLESRIDQVASTHLGLVDSIGQIQLTLKEIEAKSESIQASIESHAAQTVPESRLDHFVAAQQQSHRSLIETRETSGTVSAHLMPLTPATSIPSPEQLRNDSVADTEDYSAGRPSRDHVAFEATPTSNQAEYPSATRYDDRPAGDQQYYEHSSRDELNGGAAPLASDRSYAPNDPYAESCSEYTTGSQPNTPYYEGVGEAQVTDARFAYDDVPSYGQPVRDASYEDASYDGASSEANHYQEVESYPNQAEADPAYADPYPQAHNTPPQYADTPYQSSEYASQDNYSNGQNAYTNEEYASHEHGEHNATYGSESQYSNEYGNYESAYGDSSSQSISAEAGNYETSSSLAEDRYSPSQYGGHALPEAEGYSNPGYDVEQDVSASNAASLPAGLYDQDARYAIGSPHEAEQASDENHSVDETPIAATSNSSKQLPSWFTRDDEPERSHEDPPISSIESAEPQPSSLSKPDFDSGLSAKKGVVSDLPKHEEEDLGESISNRLERLLSEATQRRNKQPSESKPLSTPRTNAAKLSQRFSEPAMPRRVDSVEAVASEGRDAESIYDDLPDDQSIDSALRPRESEAILDQLASVLENEQREDRSHIEELANFASTPRQLEEKSFDDLPSNHEAGQDEVRSQLEAYRYASESEYAQESNEQEYDEAEVASNEQAADRESRLSAEPIPDEVPQVESHELHGSSNSSDESEESIEEYMQRLLQRVRSGPGAEPAPAPAPAPKQNNNQAARVTQQRVSQLVEPDKAAEEAKPKTSSTDGKSGRDSSRLMTPRQAPEAKSDLAALRELANSNARRAINRSDERRTNSAMLFKLAISAFSIVCALMLYSMNGLKINGSLAGMIAASVVAVLWGYDSLNQLRGLKKVKRRNDALSAEAITGQGTRQQA